MYDFIKLGVMPTPILLPKAPNALDKWAVVACDQFTSEPEYWQEVTQQVGDEPSTLNIIYPECYLSEGDQRIDRIREAMQDYRSHVLGRVGTGFVLVERQTSCGNRLGLVMAVDLEKYDFSPDSKSPIRATEQTIVERIPPRVKIRKGAPLESPHIMLLVDDPNRSLIEPIYEAREQLQSLYDFDLMMRGGHIRGWLLDSHAQGKVQKALSDLYDKSGGLLFAVGDGNHSLATARQCWLDMKNELTEQDREEHPARYALCEVVNLHDPSLQFEPIHRAIFGADSAQLSHDMVMWCRKNGMSISACDEDHAEMYLLDAPVCIQNSINPLPVAILQPFLDEWLEAHPSASIDYIHGEQALETLTEQGACCIRLKAIDKGSLFESVRKGGPLPRKTFSMGEAQDKRYYLECRSLVR
ncbi:DUF1015 domain-containing protein [Eubacteriales bacterium OttesenSCG-928-N13]|nr:DUF1015 domain-containing protein [Eubacteriales bacterium OttesenSCG-928-N13]